MQKRPVFKDTKKIIKKFQEICDWNKDIDLHVHWDKKCDPTGKYISLVWTNPYKLNVEYRFVTDVKFELEHYEYFWEEKLEKALTVIREYLKIAKKSDHERFYDIAMAMINRYREYCAQIDISLKSQEMLGRMVYLDLKHPDKVTLHMCMDGSVLATFTPEESERLYCIHQYNQSFQKAWRGR